MSFAHVVVISQKKHADTKKNRSRCQERPKTQLKAECHLCRRSIFRLMDTDSPSPMPIMPGIKQAPVPANEPPEKNDIAVDIDQHRRILRARRGEHGTYGWRGLLNPAVSLLEYEAAKLKYPSGGNCKKRQPPIVPPLFSR